MSDPAGQKKKNKKKKKTPSAAKQVPTPEPQQQPPTETCVNGGTPKDALDISKILPQKVGMKTVFKDVEVTMTHSGDVVKEVADGTSKKKNKKKKKPKQVSVESTEDVSVIDKQENFIKYNENSIELLNHPEISVTISNLVALKQETITTTTATESKQEGVGESVDSKKKKKKNKKKKKQSSENNLSAEPTPGAEDSNYSTPTYVKLPAAGDTCVLLVSHESFSNDSKTATTSTDKDTTKGSSKTVLIQSKERIEELKAISALNSQSVQNPASVSLYPVPSGPNSMPEKSTSLSMDASLIKVGDKLKEELGESNASASSLVQESGATSEETTLTKAQLKAERRAKQEAQRAAKLSKSGENKPAPPKAQAKVAVESDSLPLKKENRTENSVEAVSKALAKLSLERESPANIFSHLPQCKDQNIFSSNLSNIHPAILEIGAYYRSGVIFGSNSRCLAFLSAFREVLKDYEPQPNKELAKELESKLQIYLKFLNNCRPLSVSILNAVRFLKHQINHAPKEKDEEKIKEELCFAINNFVKEEILLAKEAICISATAKIVNGDTIMVFAYSSLVKDVLCKAFDQNKTFQVVVVESRTKMEGSEMMRRLLKHGLKCYYVPASGAFSMMKTISKVILGAHALLANGSVMSRVGSMKIVEMAESCGVPVLVCCETYKFCERALTDSFVHNELGNAGNLESISCNKNDSLASWSSLSSLQIHDILYDVTPSELISVVITEKGLLPCTSVPVVLRVKQAGLQE